MNETLDKLRERRRLAYRQFKSSMNLYVRAQQLAGALKCRYSHDERVYRDLEHEIALLDGRLTIAPPETSGKHVPKVDPANAFIEHFCAAPAEEQQRMLLDLTLRSSSPSPEE